MEHEERLQDAGAAGRAGWRYTPRIKLNFLNSRAGSGVCRFQTMLMGRSPSAEPCSGTCTCSTPARPATAQLCLHESRDDGGRHFGRLGDVDHLDTHVDLALPVQAPGGRCQHFDKRAVFGE